MNSNHSPRFQPKDFRSWVAHPSRNPAKALQRIDSIERQLSNGASIEGVGDLICKLHRQSTAFDGNGSLSALKELLGFHQMPPQNSQAWYSTHADKKCELPNPLQASAIMMSIEHERGKNRANNKRWEEEKKEIIRHIHTLLKEIKCNDFGFLIK